MQTHLAEEIAHREGPTLWDADACCAAYQLGACAHTEAGDFTDDELVAIVAHEATVAPANDDPF